MNKILSKTVFVSSLFLFLPLIALGDSGQGASAVFQNPLGNNATGPEVIIVRIINYLLGLVFVLALLALVVGGIRMVGSFGNEKSVSAAKDIIKWALIGLAITLLSWSIIGIVTGFLQAG